MYNLDELRRNIGQRRQFLKRMAAAGVGAAALGLLEMPGLPAKFSPVEVAGAATNPAFPGIPGNTNDGIVLNFALTLEILEADLYRQALNVASGLPIATGLNANPAAYTLAVPSGGLSAANAADGFTYLVQFSYAEAAHRDLLKLALKATGDTPVSPNANGYHFPGGLPANLAGILAMVLPLEETGVRAYLGALPFLVNYASIGVVAAGIFSVECRHSAVISQTLGMDPGPTPMSGDQLVIPSYPSPNTLEYFLPPATVLTRAAVYFS